MKKIIVLILITSYSYSQNPAKFISFTRSYYNNDNVLSSYTDKLKIEYDFKNNYTLSSDFSMMNLNLLSSMAYDDQNIQSLYSFDFTIDKKITLKNNWTLNLAVTPQIRSNLISSVNSSDFLINGHINAKKQFMNNTTLVFSARYGTLLGRPKPYLEFAYTFKINNKINLSLGFPKTYLEYNVNKNNSFTLQTDYEGYYTKVSTNSYSRVLEGEILKYKSLYFSRINTAVVYNYKLSDNSIIDFSIGKSFENQLEIKESNNQLTKEQFNNRFTVAIGFKYNLNFK